MKTNFSTKEKTALALTCLFIAIFLSPVISGDGFGYYALLEAIGKDQTLNLENQMRFNEVGNSEFVEFNEATERYTTPYAIGPALFSLPLYTISLFLTQFPAFHIADEFFLAERQALLLNQLAFSLTAILFVLIALFFSLKLAKKYSGEHAWIALLAAFFGTPLLWYASADPTYSHGFETGLMALLAYAILKRKDARMQGIFLGFLTITRYTSGLFAIPLLLYHLLQKDYRNSAKFLVFFAPFIALLMVYFQLQFGSPISSGYAANFFPFPIHLLEMLFDLNRGILWWTPLVLVGFYGLFLMKEKEKWLLLSFPALNLIIYACWASWHSAWAFGNRFFIMFFPLYAIGLAVLIEKKPSTKIPIAILAIYTFLLAMLFLASTPQLSDPFNLQSLIAYWFSNGNLLEFPARLLGKTSFMRVIALI